MPEKVATLRKKNTAPNLRTYSHESFSIESSDHDIERSPRIYSDSYDDLNSFQARAVRELKSLTDRLSTPSTVDDVKEHSYIYTYHFNLKIVGIPKLHYKVNCCRIQLTLSITLQPLWDRSNMARYHWLRSQSPEEDGGCWSSPDYMRIYSAGWQEIVFCLKVRMPASRSIPFGFF